MRKITVSVKEEESLVFMSMTGEEEIGRLFEFNVEVYGLEKKVQADKLLGKPATVTLDLEEKGKRHFHGFICSFAYLGRVAPFSEYGRYRMTLRPWLWFLTRISDCRIFQNEKIPDIVMKIFRENGFSDFRDTLTHKGDYKPREYCVQYRESSFSFVSRLMEQEGIYYYFDHEESKHTLVLADSPSHEPFPGYADFQFGSPDSRASWRGDWLDGWSTATQIQPAVVSLNDYDFQDPKKMMLSTQPGAPPHTDHNSYEVYDYPGEYVEGRAEGMRYAGLRMEELTAQYEQAEGHGYVRGCAPGHTFTLKDAYVHAHDKEWLVIAAKYDLSGDADTQMFSVTFRAMDNSKQYRAPAHTPKPIVYGSQTAKVVGKANEEIWTDEFNRVKVKFHWDRYAKGDETSSCWVRVSQAWAGPLWGSIYTPRIGQEVVVDFLEGDPDRPLITGRVYNKDNMPPYPGKPTQSGFKTHSTKDAGDDNFNELRFEDDKGKEHIFVQAERDLHTKVKNDEFHEVLMFRKKTVGKDETTDVGGSRKETVGKDETITIGGTRKENVKGDEIIDITGLRKESVGKDETVTVGGQRKVTISKDDTLIVEGALHITVTKEEHIGVGKELQVTAADKITFKSGAATITMKKDGTIDISGKNISVNGQELNLTSKGSTKHKAGGPMSLNGSNVTIK
jgi:type VI secretion system secreted protein VgrG